MKLKTWESATIWDLAVIANGNLGVALSLAQDNGIELDDDIAPETEIQVSQAVRDYKPPTIEPVLKVAQSQETTVLPNQSIFDITLQRFGSLNGIAQILAGNDIDPDVKLGNFSKIKAPLNSKSAVVGYYKNRNIIPETWRFEEAITPLMDKFADFFENGLGFSTVRLTDTYSGYCLRVCHPVSLLEIDIGFKEYNGRMWVDAQAAQAFFESQPETAEPLKITRAYLQGLHESGANFMEPPTYSNALEFYPNAENPDESYIRKGDTQFMQFENFRRQNYRDANSPYLNTAQHLHAAFTLVVWEGSEMTDANVNVGHYFGHMGPNNGQTTSFQIRDRYNDNPTLRLNRYTSKFRLGGNIGTFDTRNSNWWDVSVQPLPQLGQYTDDQFSEYGIHAGYHEYRDQTDVDNELIFIENLIKQYIKKYEAETGIVQIAWTQPNQFGAYKRPGDPAAAGFDCFYSTKLFLRALNDKIEFKGMSPDKTELIYREVEKIFKLPEQGIHIADTT